MFLGTLTRTVPAPNLDEVNGGATRSAINIGSFGTVSSGAIKSKIKVGGVGNWDEGESELTAG